MKETTSIDGPLLVSLKTAAMRTPGQFRVEKGLTVGDLIGQLHKRLAGHPELERLSKQVARETSGGRYDFLAFDSGGRAKKVAPATKLEEIIVPREVEIDGRRKTIATAAVEVQGYAPVG